MAQDAELTIGELAKSTGTRAGTIRYYERIGLLTAPTRSAGNYRLYGRREVDRLGFVRRSRDLGFGIEEIRALLSLADQHERDCGEIDAIARQHLSDVEHKLADLRRLAEERRHIIAQCRGGKVADCRIVEALAPKRRQAR
jgi:Cu(I)-responsive transcriptional regulator